MNCTCGGEYKVVDSRPGSKNTIRRSRECLVCKNRVTTYEYISLYPSIKSANRSNRLRRESAKVPKTFFS